MKRNNNKIPEYFSTKIVPLLFFILIVACGCSPKKPLIKQSKVLMGTIAEITVYDETDLPAVEPAFDAMEDIEKLASRFLPDSELNKININAGRKPVKVDALLFDMIERSVHFSRISGGAFDITIGPIVSLWSIGVKQSVPDDKEIREKLKLVSYKNIALDRANNTVFLKKNGMQIDLGGVAKGYAVDRAVEVLKEKKVSRAIVQIGGEIGFLGRARRKIGIQHPRDQNKLLAMLTLSDESVSSSGDYYRYFIRNGIRYHHIFDPRDGYPARVCQAVTVVTGKKLDADVLSTAVFILGAEKGMELAESLPGTGCLIVTASGEILVSKGLKQKVQIKAY